jgi:thymidylate synthase (FAD)
MVRELEPKVIKIAETKTDPIAIDELMKEYGASAQEWYSKRAPAWKSNGETLIEIAGRACYRSFGTGLNPNLTKVRSESGKYFENILRRGDGSILEHATVTFALMWISRVLTHQLVRHRAGTAFSQESLRYVRATEIQIPSLSVWAPRELPEDARDELMKALFAIEKTYKSIDAKIPWSTLSFDEKKRATSAIRRILPQGISTVIIFTANHRALRWMIEMRTDPAAEVEIRQIFSQIAEICIRDYPLLYSDFDKSILEDGTTQYKPKLRSKV